MGKGRRHFSLFRKNLSTSLLAGNRNSSRSSGAPHITQIIWFAIGTTVVIDTAYMVGQWSNLAIVILTSTLMITSPWLGKRVLMLLSVMSIPFLFSLMFLSWPNYMAQGYTWTGKTAEYVSEVLLMVGVCLGMTSLSAPSGKWTFVGKVVAYGSVLLGCIAAVYAYAGSVAGMAEEATFLLLLPQLPYYTSYLFSLNAHQGASPSSISHLDNIVSKKTKLPLPMVALLLGTLGAVIYDGLYQIFCKDLSGNQRYFIFLFYGMAFLLSKGYRLVLRCLSHHQDKFQAKMTQAEGNPLKALHSLFCFSKR